MKEHSAGILVYRLVDGQPEVLLGKCGGPKWARRNDEGVWNIPKGHIEPGESELAAAYREFTEETSLQLPKLSSVDEFIDLGKAKTLSGNKEVQIFAIEYDFNPGGDEVEIKSNMCETEWPPKSGKMIQVPELSECKYFDLETAKTQCFPYQKIFIERLEEQIKENESLRFDAFDKTSAALREKYRTSRQ